MEKPPLILLHRPLHPAFYSAFRQYIGFDVNYLTRYHGTMTEAEAVLAHELAHANDSFLRGWLILWPLMPAVSSFVSLAIAAFWHVRLRQGGPALLDGAAAVTIILIALVLTLLVERFVTRQCEYAADARASLYVGSTEPLSAMFARLARHQPVQRFSERIWDTHPALHWRIAALRSLR